MVEILGARLKTFLEVERSRHVRQMENLNMVFVWLLFLEGIESSEVLNTLFGELMQRQMIKIVSRLPDLMKEEREEMFLEEEKVFGTFELVESDFIEMLTFLNYVDNFKKVYASNESFLEAMENRAHKIEDKFG